MRNAEHFTDDVLIVLVVRDVNNFENSLMMT